MTLAHTLDRLRIIEHLLVVEECEGNRIPAIGAKAYYTTFSPG
jgi:hypothetical protein